MHLWVSASSSKTLDRAVKATVVSEAPRGYLPNTREREKKLRRLHVDLRPVGKGGEPARDQGIGRGGALLVLGTEVGILLVVLIHLAHFLRARKEGVIGLWWLDSDRLQRVSLRV